MAETALTKQAGTVRVGILGLGTHAQRNVLPALRQSRKVKLVAAHTRNRAVLEKAADALAMRRSESLEAMLASDDIDAIYIATPTGLHFDAAMATLTAGKHVWCEKPLTAGYAQSLEVVAEARQRGLVALEADMFLHHPQFVQLKNIVDSGELGEIRSVTGRFGFPHRPAEDFRYSGELGGGALLDAGFYPVAAAVALLGGGLDVAGSNLQYDKRFEVDIGGTALLANAGCAAIADWGFGRSYRSELEVWCESGTIHTQRAYAKPGDLVTSITIHPQSGGRRVVDVAPAAHFELMIEHFARTTISAHYEPAAVLERARLLEAIRQRAISDDTA